MNGVLFVSLFIMYTVFVLGLSYYAGGRIHRFAGRIMFLRLMKHRNCIRFKTFFEFRDTSEFDERLWTLYSRYRPEE